MILTGYLTIVIINNGHLWDCLVIARRVVPSSREGGEHRPPLDAWEYHNIKVVWNVLQFQTSQTSWLRLPSLCHHMVDIFSSVVWEDCHPAVKNVTNAWGRSPRWRPDSSRLCSFRCKALTYPWSESLPFMSRCWVLNLININHVILGRSPLLCSKDYRSWPPTIYWAFIF